MIIVDPGRPDDRFPGREGDVRSGHIGPERGRSAFTLIELLVVVTIIVVLLALLTPALDKAIEQAERAVCGANLNVIHHGTVTYALQNKSAIFQARTNAVQISFDYLGQAHGGDPGHGQVDWVAALATVGLASAEKFTVAGGVLRHEPATVWDCPSRQFRSNWDDAQIAGATGTYIIIGYQYFGGVFFWRNMEGTFPSRSPIKVNKSEPDWVLAADTTMKIDGAWGGSAAARPTSWKGIPSHKRSDGVRPEGHNQSYMDGSVGWVDFKRMYYISAWGANSPNRASFFHQRDLGAFDPTPGVSGAQAWE
jgi:prepilin-type N-terminal cleavage/methylation domain-containing protein